MPHPFDQHVSPTEDLVAWGRDYATLVERFGPLPAVETPDGSCSLDDLVGRAAAVAETLRQAGVGPGDPVATFLRNSRTAVWAGYGVTLAGACETALNANLSPAEVAYCVDLARVNHAVTDAASAPMFRALGVHTHVAEEIGAAPRPLDHGLAVPGAAWGKILFTSGTTGRPKAIVHSHRRRWLANVLQRAHLPYMPGPESQVLLMTPYTHGASLITYAYLDHGASIYLADGVDTDIVRGLLERRAIDAMFAPPTVLAKIVRALDGGRYDCLRVIYTGTATLTPALYRAARNMFGPIVRVTYGKSEMVNPITILPPDGTEAFYKEHPDASAANLGWPGTGVEVAIRDETGIDCAPGADGEIFLRSPHMLVGYVDGAGYHKLGPDEWHATGDIGHLSPTGELFLAGRAGDVIKSGGYKIFPQEIELALVETDAAHVVAVGMPSDYWGEVIVAAAEGASPGWEERASAAAETLTRYKRPRAYVTLDALPRVGQDKISRKRVAERIGELYRLEDGPHPKLVAR
jgi:acyl-CoA synthetase (AMP-forming)/AMP-acid ligase II